MTTFAQAFQSFLAHCSYERKLSPKTIKFYSIDLSQFLNFIGNETARDVKSITKLEIRGFLESLSSLKPKSIKRKIATLKALFTFLEFDDVIQINPMRKLKIRIKEPRVLPTVLDLSEIGRIITSVYSRKKKSLSSRCSYAYKENLRNVAVIELLFATGGRVSEIANLKTTDLDLNTGVVVLRGKGNKERIVQIVHNDVLKVLQECCDLWHRDNISPYLLLNRLGCRLSDQSIRNLVKSLSKEVGIQKRVTPHVFRHSFATLLLERDVDIKYIQSLLGHSSILTTQIYTHVNRVKQRSLLVSKHPRKDMLIQGYRMQDN